MARFGLLDSDSEGSDVEVDTSQHSQDESHFDQQSSSSSQSQHEEEDDEEAPPRASLLSDDEEEEDQDSQSVTSSEESIQYSRSNRSISQSQPPQQQRRPIPFSTSSSNTQKPWAQQLKLEPKRVQVMQASFFGQTPKPDQSEVRQREREELEREREGKRSRIEQGLAQRNATSSLFPTAPTPRPQSTIQPEQPQQSVPTPILDPAPFRPYRHYSRVPLSTSITNDREGTLVDIGLALGRSYRVGWGQGGEIVSLKGVYDKEEENGKGKSDTLKVEKLKLVSEEDKSASLRLLKLQLSHTQIYPSHHTDSTSLNSIPFAAPLPDLRFHHFVESFQSSTTSSSTNSDSHQPQSQDDHLSTSQEAQLFKLAHCLFDEINDLSLPLDEGQLEFQTPSYRSTIERMRRRDALSSWLQQNLLPNVTSQINNQTDSSNNDVEKIFLLLTAHEVSKACDVSIQSSNLRLATLLSQLGTSSGTTSREFQEDVEKQLERWREYKVDSQVSKEVRKVYEVLSGNLGVSKGRPQGGGGGGVEDRVEESHVLEGLEWKVAFAMGLWYGRSESNGGGGGIDEVGKAMEWYEEAWKSDQRVRKPLPSRQTQSSSSSSSKENDIEKAQDPVYHLLKLYTSATHSLESSLSPVNFGTSKGCRTDYRLPWHLYLIFSRVLRRRDFEDRIEVEGGGMVEGEEVEEGNSVRADQVTMSYAAQLESIGMWEWSVFVLLHLELEAPRAQAIQQILTRNVTAITPSIETFLLETLQIPPTYLALSRSVHAQSLGDVFATYKLLLSAQRPEPAHRIAVEELVPEAIVRGDKGLVERLLEPFREDREEEDEEENGEDELRGTVEEWEQGGKIYLMYLRTLSLFSSPSTMSLSSSHSYLSSTISQVQQFSIKTRSIDRTKDNKKLKMAVGEMQSRLNVLSRHVGGKSLSVTQPRLLPESDKLVWLQGATNSFFESSLKRCTV